MNQVAVTNLKAEFQCINPECGTRYPLDRIIYNCEKCGEILRVEHDLSALKSKSGADWRELLDSRYKSVQFPNTSGIWSKRELVLPHIEDQDIVSSGEGFTHLFHSDELSKAFGVSDLYVKQCGISHTGSFKDLGMTVLLSQVKHMIRKGIPIDAVACASSGDTSAALASYAAKARIPAIIFLPAGKVSPAQLAQPVANGALVIALETDFDGCMKIVREVTQEKNIYLANSMNSLRIEGQKTISIEIAQQMEWKIPDWIVIPGGNLGNVSALGAGYKLMHELGIIDTLPRIAVAQAENANPLYKSFQKQFQEFSPVEARKTLASAIQIGNPVSVKKAIQTLNDFSGVVEQASEAELANAAALGDIYGLYNDPHTGVALAALQKLRNENIIRQEETVVVISTAHGLKFTEFKTDFHEGKIPGIRPDLQNRIQFCRPDLSEVMDTIKKQKI